MRKIKFTFHSVVAVIRVSDLNGAGDDIVAERQDH